MKWLIKSRPTLKCLRYSLSVLLHVFVGFKGASVDPGSGRHLWTKPQMRKALQNAQKIVWSPLWTAEKTSFVNCWSKSL